MASISEPLSSTDNKLSEMPMNLLNEGAPYRIKPYKGLVGILATPEKNQKFHSELIESVGQPLYVKCKKCAGLRFNLRNQPCPACDGEGVIRNGRAWDMQWIGRVFGVADDCAWSGLNFGDVVQLSRMAECQWFFRPVGFEGWTGTYYMESDDGSVRLEAHGSEAWVFLKPEQIPVVLMQRKHGVDYVSCVPGIVAGPHRLLVRLFNDNNSLRFCVRLGAP